jgi:hypothetical protein
MGPIVVLRANSNCIITSKQGILASGRNASKQPKKEATMQFRRSSFGLRGEQQPKG